MGYRYITLLIILTVAFSSSVLFFPRPLSGPSHSPETHLPEPLHTKSEKMSPSRYVQESRVAIGAVRQAASISRQVFRESSKGTLSKDDASPVTVADYAVQAVITSHIHVAFPNDRIVGEEDSAMLRSQPELVSRIWHLVSNSQAEEGARSKSQIKSSSELLDLIDRGIDPGGPTGRIWALDPIDGTKGFLRGGQYAICLALIVDGETRLGVLGCPNLSPLNQALKLEDGHEQTGDAKGVLFMAIQSLGAVQEALIEDSGDTIPEPISMRRIGDPSEAIFCESLEPTHSSQGEQAQVVKRLGSTKQSVRMDSQAKYGSVARGAADIYLRLPSNPKYEEMIWDHAAGDIIVREAGGMVTNIHGKRLDFSRGRTLGAGNGVVAAPATIHAQVLSAVQEVLRL